jgi:multidrug resistance efflux pump
MVVIIVLSWILLLFALVHFGVLKRWTLWMKISPLIVYLISMLFLFIPMGSGAPAGPLTVMAYSVQVAPHVSGVVTDVPIKAGVLGQKETLTGTGAGGQTDVEQYDAEVKSLTAQLEAATWDLEQTTVKAPADAYVPNQGIQPGTRVNAGVAVMPDISKKAIVLNVPQNGYRNIRVGHRAELAFEMYPGQVFKGKVKYIAPANAAGELTPTGLVASIKSSSEPFLVELELDEPLDLLPPGAVGTGAVYTDSLQITHPVRAVILRGRTWLNYL